MNRRSAPALDPFETALLAQLKSMVAESAAAEPDDGPEPADRPPAHRRRVWYAAIGAATAAFAAALVVQGLWPTPAYAVSGANNGEVTVRVTRLEGAEGLESALGDHGIPADITYLPEGKQCAPGRYTAVSPRGLTLAVSADDFEVTIPPGAVGEDDIFVLSAAVAVLPDEVRAMVDFDIARGSVAPCRAIDAP